MNKNILIGALCGTVIALAVCLYSTSKENASNALKLKNCELNVLYEKAIK